MLKVLIMLIFSHIPDDRESAADFSGDEDSVSALSKAEEPITEKVSISENKLAVTPPTVIKNAHF